MWNSFGTSITAVREIDFDYGIGGVSLQGFNDLTAAPWRIPARYPVIRS